MSSLAVLGAGSWGTALAIVLAARFDQVRLWVYEPELAEELAGTRENSWFLPGFRLPPNINVCRELAEALSGAGIVLGVMPSNYARGVYRQAAGLIPPEALVVSATKGLEEATLQRMSEVIAEVLGPSVAPRLAVLSGPTFAREVAAGHPTALVVASRNLETAQRVQTSFSGPTFRLYTNPDVTGVELAASLKNVIAIGAGIVEGLGLGSNTAAALITRGLAEITRLAVASGGQPETLSGLAGLGDLVLTCTGALSRNRQVGIALAKGRSIAEITASMRMVAEGVKTAAAARSLARQHQVEMPITEQMNAVLDGEVHPREALLRLMQRGLKPEAG